MKSRMPKPLALALALFAANAAMAQDTDAVAVANRLLDRLDAHDYAQAEAMFAPKMAQAVPVDKLQTIWESLPQQAGAALGRGTAETATKDGVALVRVPLHYAKAELQARLVVDAEGRIAGLLIQPAEAPSAAAVDANANFGERDFSVGAGERALPGTLAMPKGKGPFPAVVLVHGSGPQDRDETIGPNKPFLDIARGLAAQGIAVLRYEKRTKARPEDFADGHFSVDDETTHDAVLAVDALRKTPGIDPQRVFVLGHSQGGMMAPRIAAQSAHVAGIVLMAAPARSLLDILIEQNQRLALLDDGKTSDAERDAIAKLTEQVRQTRDPATDAAAKGLMGGPVGYWRSVDAVHPLAEAKADHLPMLLLQGSRDIQVVDADWRAWHQAFDADKRATFKQYPKLNHLGIAGEGPSNIAEYMQPGHVDAQLIDDVAAWIKAH